MVPLSLELPGMNEPAALKSIARSVIRIDLFRESPIGAWATLVTSDHPLPRMPSETNRVSNPTTNNPLPSPSQTPVLAA
jgi:hypothetical protein